MVKIFVVHYSQDDPRKCTALKMVRLGYATRVSGVHEIPKGCLILNPLATEVLTPLDRTYVSNHGLAVIDTSWNEGLNILKKLTYLRRPQRVLPVLFAGNPINYGVATRLSSLEAVASALYIVGYRDEALKLLSIVKWGRTFYELNKELLEAYSNSRDVSELLNIQGDVLKRLGIFNRIRCRL